VVPSLFTFLRFNAEGIGMQIDDRASFVTGIKFIQKSKHHSRLSSHQTCDANANPSVRYPCDDAFFNNSSCPQYPLTQ
jgi:hypothetical protein